MTHHDPTPGAGPYRKPVRPTLRGWLQRGLLVVVLGVVLGGVGGIGLTALAHKKYTAASRVLVTQTGLDTSSTQSTSGRTTDSINLDTEAQLVTSNAVVQGATELYPSLTRRSFDDLVSSTEVTVPPNTTVLRIAFTADTPASAQAGSVAFATAYLNDRQKTAQTQLDRRIANATASVDRLTTRLQELTGRTPPGTQRAFVDAQSTLVKNQITAVNNQLVTLNNIQVTPGRLLAAAARPTTPSSPSRLIDVGSGLAAGLLVGLVAAWLLVRYRRKVRTQDDLTHAVDAPCIAVLPFADASGAQGAAIYRRIALVATTAVGADRMCLVVTSPLDSASGSWVAAGIAASLDHGGTPTALVQVHPARLELGAPPSVSSVHVGRADDLVGDTGVSLTDALDRVRGPRPAVVVDVPGATVGADAQTLAAHADAVLLVVDARTRTRVVRAAVEYLDSVGSPLLGTVLVRRGGRPLDSVPEADDDAPASPRVDPPEPKKAPPRTPPTKAPARKQGQRRTGGAPATAAKGGRRN